MKKLGFILMAFSWVYSKPVIAQNQKAIITVSNPTSSERKEEVVAIAWKDILLKYPSIDTSNFKIINNLAKKDVPFHMLHVHDMLFCNACQKYIEHDQEHQCPRRIVKCRHCPECMEAEGIIEHLLVHLQESKQRCELLKDILEKEKKMSQQILRQCSQYFTEIYNDTL